VTLLSVFKVPISFTLLLVPSKSNMYTNNRNCNA
jgi:hypothetical protein